MDASSKIEWTKQLYKEFERFNWLFRAGLSKSIIRIEKLVQSYGTWDAFTSTITMSEDLILTKSWHQVLEVLKHEMAHQLVSEKFRVHEHHGEFFEQACQQLRVEAWARKASIRLEDHLENHLIPEREATLLRQTKKLLALAKSSNKNEALAAIAKVRELSQRYNLEQLQANEASTYTSVYINHKKKRFETYQTLIIALLVKHYGVDAVYTHLYCAKSNTEHRAVELLGMRQNINISEYVYWFLFNNLKSYWHDYLHEKPNFSSIKSRNQFFNGVIKGFYEQLSSQKRKEMEQSAANSTSRVLATTGQSVIKQEKKQLQEFVRYKHPRLMTRQKATSSQHGAAFLAGIEKGKQLVLHAGLDKSRREQLRLLPAAR